MNIKMPTICSCFAILVLGFGCAPSSINTLTPTSVPVATQGTPSPTAYSPRTSTPTETSTQLSPSLTPFPTLSAEEAKEKWLELLRNNGGCQLPCILGYLPGKTTKVEMQQFFNQFVENTSGIEISKLRDSDIQTVDFYFPHENVNFNTGIAAWYQNDSPEISILNIDTLLTGQIDYPWSPYYYDVLKSYLLSNVLANLGEPPQVLVWAVGDDPDRPDVTLWPFYLTVIYPEQGIYLKYEMKRHRTGNIYFGCPSKSYVRVAVWDPEDDKSFDQVIQIMNNSGDLSPYKPLEDATSMTIDEFANIFSNPNNTICLETPIEIWP